MRGERTREIPAVLDGDGGKAEPAGQQPQLSGEGIEHIRGRTPGFDMRGERLVLRD